ncbi:hypothetical protein [Marinobacter fuscus]|nr:hypothetical protein [Marinobacter fuscus]
MMKIFATGLVAVLLSACGGPETPQEVSEAFWQAVIEGDAGDVSDYSTLVDGAAFDHFGRDWKDAVVIPGRVVIEDSSARIDIRLQGVDNTAGDIAAATYLVQKDGEWLVDYYRTGDALEQKPIWSGLASQLEQLGQDLQARWARQSDELALELDRMGKELQKQAEATTERWAELAEEYGQELSRELERLSKSLTEALRQNPSASPEDRRKLNESVNRLEASQQGLEDPQLAELLNSTRVAVETQLNFEQLDTRFDRYKADWREQVAEIRQGLARFVEDLKAPAS